MTLNILSNLFFRRTKVRLFFLLSILFFFTACGDDSEEKNNSKSSFSDLRNINYSTEFGKKVYSPSDLPSVDSLYQVNSAGASPENAEKVILYAQGGPVNQLDDRFAFKRFTSQLPDSSTKWAIIKVHQYQTLNPDYGKEKELGINDAIDKTAYTAAILFKVTKYFSEQGKKVYILSHSYGSFITPKMLIDYKYENYVEKVLILAGRLAIQTEVYQIFSRGNITGFNIVTTEGDDYDLAREYSPETVMNLEALKEFGAPIPEGYTEQEFLNQERTFRKLQASLGQYRYSDIIRENNIPLSKVMFSTGKRDQAVGFFSDDEQAAATSNGGSLHISDFREAENNDDSGETENNNLTAHAVSGDEDIAAYIEFFKD